MAWQRSTGKPGGLEPNPTVGLTCQLFDKRPIPVVAGKNMMTLAVLAVPFKPRNPRPLLFHSPAGRRGHGPGHSFCFRSKLELTRMKSWTSSPDRQIAIIFSVVIFAWIAMELLEMLFD